MNANKQIRLAQVLARQEPLRVLVHHGRRHGHGHRHVGRPDDQYDRGDHGVHLDAGP